MLREHLQHLPTKLSISRLLKCDSIQFSWFYRSFRHFSRPMERLNTGQLERSRLGWRNLRICSEFSRSIFLASGVGCGVKSIGLNSKIYGTRRKPLTTCSIDASYQSENFLPRLWFEPLHYRRHTHYRQRRQAR
jgi:hypothetical protein